METEVADTTQARLPPLPLPHPLCEATHCLPLPTGSAQRQIRSTVRWLPHLAAQHAKRTTTRLAIQRWEETLSDVSSRKTLKWNTHQEETETGSTLPAVAFFQSPLPSSLSPFPLPTPPLTRLSLFFLLLLPTHHLCLPFEVDTRGIGGFSCLLLTFCGNFGLCPPIRNGPERDLPFLLPSDAAVKKKRKELSADHTSTISWNSPLQNTPATRYDPNMIVLCGTLFRFATVFWPG